jgi:hypothetical protein
MDLLGRLLPMVIGHAARESYRSFFLLLRAKFINLQLQTARHYAANQRCMAMFAFFFFEAWFAAASTFFCCLSARALFATGTADDLEEKPPSILLQYVAAHRLL